MTRYVLMTMLLTLPVAAAPAERPLSFTKLWTHGHTTPGQLSEIPAFDRRTNTVWVAGVVGVDVLDGETGTLVEHIDVTGYGLVNSVAIHNGLAAFAIEAGHLTADGRCRRLLRHADAAADRRSRDRRIAARHADVHARRQQAAGGQRRHAQCGGRHRLYAPDPPGSVSIIDVETRTVIATAGFDNVPQFGTNLRTNVGMDFEPEYIAIEKNGSRAFVTIQEANAIAVLDLSLNAFTEIIGLGAKDFSIPGNEIDPKDNDGKVEFINAAATGLYMPDGVASYKWRGHTYLVLANEGDFREDNVDRSAAGSAPYFARRSPGPPAHFEQGFFAGQSVCGRRPLHVDSRVGRDAGVRQRQHPRHRGPQARCLRRRPQPRQGCGTGGRRAYWIFADAPMHSLDSSGRRAARSQSSTSPIPTTLRFST